MSFSFSFNSRTKASARKRANELRNTDYVPGEVIDFVTAGIDALPDDPKTIIAVSAHGHLVQGRGSSMSANATIEVRQIPIDD